MSISVNVLDTLTGRPVADLSVTLHACAHDTWPVLARAVTDSTGSSSFRAEALPPGTYRLVFGTGAYFAEQAVDSRYPEVVLSVRYPGHPGRLHMPLLLSPFSYTTYDVSESP